MYESEKIESESQEFFTNQNDGLEDQIKSLYEENDDLKSNL